MNAILSPLGLKLSLSGKSDKQGEIYNVRIMPVKKGNTGTMN